MLAYLAAFVLALILGLIGVLLAHSLKRWGDPLGGTSRFGSIPKERVRTVERQDALRRAS